MATRVLLDTTVLCGAIRQPNGVSFELLRLAALRIFEPVITEEIIAEWVRNCRLGLGRGRSKVVFNASDIEAFCEAFDTILDPQMIARVRIGRAASPLYPIRKEADMTMIQVPLGTSTHSSRMLDDRTFAIKDIGDFHVVEAAVNNQCNYICTRNTKDFQDGLIIGGRIEVTSPDRLYPLLILG